MKILSHAILLLFIVAGAIRAQDTVNIVFVRDTVYIGTDTLFTEHNDTLRLGDTTSVKVQTDYALKELDTSAMPASILIEKCVLSHDVIKQFDGKTTNDTSMMSVPVFELLQAQFPLGYVRDGRRITSIDTLSQRAQLSVDSGVIPIGMLMTKYCGIRSNALDDTLLRRTAGGRQLVDVPGRTGSPYYVDTLFAACPLQQYSRGTTVYFITDTSLYYSSNIDDTVRSVRIDFGDGNGYRTISNDSKVTVMYADTGTKTLRVLVVHGRNSVDTSLSRSWIYVAPELPEAVTGTSVNSGPYFCSQLKASDILDRAASPRPCLEWEIGATKAYPSNSTHRLSGLVSIWYGCGNTQLKRPVIFVEGFDMKDDMDWQKFYERYDQYNSFFLTRLRNAGYDIVFLNSFEGTNYVQSNAYLLESVITRVNQNKVGNEQLVIVGESMGGVVARYALADMERDHIDHNTRLLICNDSPQRGAVAPIGMQEMARFTEHYFDDVRIGQIVAFAIFTGMLSEWGMVTATTDLITLFKLQKLYDHHLLPSMMEKYHPASLQLLDEVAHIEWVRAVRGVRPYEGGSIRATDKYDMIPRTIYKEHALRTALMQELNDLGYPTNVRLVATTSGQMNGIHQDNNQAVNPPGPPVGGEPLHDFQMSALFGLLSYASGYFKASPNASQGLRNISGFWSHFLWVFQSGSNLSIKSPRCYESMPGGWQSALNAMNFGHGVQSAWDVILGLIGSGMSTNSYYSNLCLVPTVSALDVNTENWDMDLESYLQSNPTATPFNAYYWPKQSANLPHTYWNNTIMNEILSQEIFNEDIYIQNTTIDRSRDYRAVHDVVVGNDVYPAGFSFHPVRPAPGNVNVSVRSHEPMVNIVAGNAVILKDGFRTGDFSQTGNGTPTVDPTKTGMLHVYIEPQLGPCSDQPSSSRTFRVPMPNSNTQDQKPDDPTILK